jgi:hypothetical protein
MIRQLRAAFGGGTSRETADAAVGRGMADVLAALDSVIDDDASLGRIYAGLGNNVPGAAPGRRAGTARSRVGRLRAVPGRWRVAPRRWRLAVAGGLAVAVAAASFGVATVVAGGGNAQPAASSAVLLAKTAAAHAAAQPPVPAGQWIYRKTLDRTVTPSQTVLTCVPVKGQPPVLTKGLSLHPYMMIDGGGAATSTSTVGQSRTPAAGEPCFIEHGRITGRQLAAPKWAVRGTVKWVTTPATNSVQRSEAWSTADSTKQASYQHGKLVVSAACACGFTSYADLSKLPSDPETLVKQLMRAPGGQQGHWTTAQGAWNAFNGIEGALTDYVVPPKVAAELYRALGDIPGVTVDMNAVDPADRPGPALVLTVTDNPGGPWTAEVFLDPSTYQLTGYSEHFPAQCQCPSPGSGETAILNQALVSGPGVRP